MAKLLKIIARTIGITLEWVLFLLIVFAFAVRTSTFQTFLGRLATDYLSKELNTEIRVGKIDIVILNRIVLKDVFVRDRKGDTLASVGTVDIHISSFNLSGNAITVSEAIVGNGRIAVNRDSLSGEYNYAFLVNYFGSDKPSDPNSDPMKVAVKQISLNSIDLSYDDNRKAHSPYGLDFDHLHFRNVNLSANSFVSNKGKLGLTIAKFSATEQCGLKLDQLKVGVLIDPKKGILLSNVEIRTPQTKIYASKFNLLVNDFDDFNDFNNKVRFDAIIDSSEVDLKDVSLFVPAMEGMDQKVFLSTTLQKPLNWLTLNDFDLRFGKRTIVRGNFVLPDFSNMDKAALHEEISYCFVDLEDVKALHLPKTVDPKATDLQPMIQRLAYVELKKTTVEGTTKQFVLASNRISTQLGALKVNNGIQFTSLDEGGYAFKRTANSNYDIAVDSFQLGKFLDNDMLGKVQGEFFLTGVAGQKDVIRLTELAGDIERFGFNNYGYSNITVTEGSFVNNIFDANIAINDPHLKMTYDGSVDVNKIQEFKFDLTIDQADLGDLHLGDASSSVVGELDIDIKGTNIDNYEGKVAVQDLTYHEKGKDLKVPDLKLNLDRGSNTDSLTITSDVADIKVIGKMTSGNLIRALNNSFSELFPTIIKPIAFSTKKKITHEFFNATITTKNTAEVLDLYYPELHIAEGTVITASYDSQTDIQKMHVTSPEIALIPITKDSIKPKRYLENLVIDETLEKGDLKLTLDAEKAVLNDSLYVRKFDVDVANTEGVFNSKIRWNQKMEDSAYIEFNTELKPNNEYEFLVKPSYFSVQSQLWKIKKQALVKIENKRILFDNLNMEKDNQFIGINGVLSDDEKEALTLQLKEVHVEEFSKILDPSLDIKGRLDGTVDLRTPFTSLSASGDIVLSQFFMNKQEIGTISLDGVWNPVKEMVSMNGKLDYLDNKETFAFYGSFYPLREDNNYSIDLRFKKTDLAFANAFVPVDVVSNIKGKLEGRLKLTGKTAAPDINGKVTLTDGSVKVGLLGTTYRLGGDLKFDGENDFITAILPVQDQENNNAILDVQIAHSDFKNFAINLDFWFDRESVTGVYKRPFTGKFMVLNTEYKEGDIYYGTAYASGSANISIQETLTDISVNARTEEGTVVNLPMYGASDVSDFDFIEFVGDGVDKTAENSLSGLNLDLTINATSDAQINLIFNPKTGDAIDATGSGEIRISIDQTESVKMFGTYTLAGGGYNLSMPPIKERFILKPGGTIGWSGTPYETDLNLSTYVIVNASVSDLAGDTGTDTKYRKKPVRCYMDITGNLNKPVITLRIEMPDATSEEKSQIARATSTVDDTQAQWFYLLSQRRFKSLNGGSGGGTAGVNSLVASQVNDMLKNLQPAGFELSVAADDKTNSVSTKRKLGKKVEFTGSLGKTTPGVGEAPSNALATDAKIDVLFNDDGTFKMSVFNESNDKSSLGGSENGDNTQGVSLSYSEQFNRFSESRLLELLLPPFNRKGGQTPPKKNTKTVDEAIKETTEDKKEQEEPTPDPDADKKKQVPE